MRDNMVLHDVERRYFRSHAAQIRQELAAMNLKWYTRQKERQQQVMVKRMEKKQSHVDLGWSMLFFGRIERSVKEEQ